MKSLKYLVLGLLIAFSTGQLVGQASGYYSLDYMKVEPANVQDYLACEKAWKKIHAYKKEKGQIQSWALDQVMSPSGANVEYNFVTRHSYKDRHQLAAHQEGSFMPENWESLLTAEEIALVNRTGSLRTLVKSEVWSAEERVLAEDLSDANVHVFNFFKMPEGVGRSAHLEMERALWMPFHKANIKNGKSKGWVLLNRELPMGSGYGYDIATVDVYTDMGQFWEPFDAATFEKLHPGKSMNDIMEQTRALGMRKSAEVRRSVDALE
ncbi:MAG: hypothetical protein KTR24_04230 [Saprospiraceae bacterium]|nr:hypothetical protein [Saprospiraceae bacterium]